MLIAQEIRRTSQRRTRVLAFALFCASWSMIVYFVVFAHLLKPPIARNAESLGARVVDTIEVVAVLSSIAIFLVPMAIGTGYANRLSTRCPTCGDDLSKRVEQLLATHCCPLCDVEVVAGGRRHSREAYERYKSKRSRRFLWYWLWAWPVMSISMMTWSVFDRSAFERCPQLFVMIPLLGTSTAGWTWLRTRDWRYSPQSISSLALIGLGAYFFWRSF